MSAIVPRPDEIRPDPLTQADYEAIKGVLRTYRDTLIVKLLRGTGLRISEALSLTRAHVNDSGLDSVLTVMRGKQAGAPLWDRVPLPRGLGLELRDYIRGQPRHQEERIFPVTTRRIQQVVRAAGIAAIGRPVHPHEFRALYIKHMLDAGAPPAMVAKLVGHSDVRITMAHYYGLTLAQRQEVANATPV